MPNKGPDTVAFPRRGQSLGGKAAAAASQRLSTVQDGDVCQKAKHNWPVKHSGYYLEGHSGEETQENNVTDVCSLIDKWANRT